ncbi:hypothetical protein AHF37_05501 [Paragonimus kellicotti]|nr:hypothetical protein AHF37_05501 [Paragonimus kellicotti]
MSAFLQALGWVYPLSPKLTTIGQSGCDIIIDNPSVDEQHAVIERNERENIITIRDLSSKKGTYVNNVLIGKSSVMLKPRDQLRFGCSPTVYEFELMSPNEKLSLYRKHPFDTNKLNIPPWMQSNGGATSDAGIKVTENTNTRNSVEKDEMSQSLSNNEAISAQKDILIRRLQQQVTQLSISKIPRSVLLTQESPSAETKQAYERLEIPVSPSAHDIMIPTDTVDSSPTCAIRSNTRPVSASSTGPAYQISSQPTVTSATGSLTIDQHLVERLKKERQILSGLVTQLQRDLTNKDAYIGRLNQDLKEMGRKLDEKNTELSILQAKFAKAHDNSKYLQQTETHEKELTAVRQKYKVTEIRCDALNSELDRTKLEMEKLKRALDEKQGFEERWHKEMDEMKSTMASLERSERNAKLDKQETVSQQSVTDLTGLRSSSRLKSHLEMLNTFSPTSKCTKRLQEFLMEDLQQQINASQRLEDCIQEVTNGLSSVCTDYPVSLTQRPDDLICTIRRLAQISMTVQADRERVKKLLKEAETQSSEALERAKQSFQRELERKIEEALVKNNEEQLQSEHKLLQGRLTEAQRRLSATKKTPTVGGDDRSDKCNNMTHRSSDECTNDVLRNEVAGLRTLLTERNMTIDALRADLKGTRAQLSDLRGELTEAQKEEIESALEFGKRTSSELANTRAKLSHLTDIVEGLRSEVTQKDEAIKKHLSISNELQSGKHAQELTQFQSISKLTEELAVIGGECRGERHLEVISKQREALSQLRQRLRDHPTGNDEGAGDAYVHSRQLASLRREVAELRSQNLMSEVFPRLSPNGVPALDVGPLVSDEGHRTGDITGMEKSGLRNAMDALQTSEESYLDLVRSIALHLELGTLPGQRSLVLVPSAEREAVRRERRQAAELLSQRVAVLREQVERKDQLLSNYDRDMGKLR